MATIEQLQKYYTTLEEEFNHRQLEGKDCEDLVELMIHVIFQLRRSGRWAVGNGRDHVH